MLESKIRTSIKKYLESLGHVVFVYHGGAYSVTAFTDLHGHLVPSGRAFYIEVKQPGKKPTPAQLKFIERMEDSCALAFWCDSLEYVKELIP